MNIDRSDIDIASVAGIAAAVVGKCSVVELDDTDIPWEDMPVPAYVAETDFELRSLNFR